MFFACEARAKLQRIGSSSQDSLILNPALSELGDLFCFWFQNAGELELELAVGSKQGYPLLGAVLTNWWSS